MASFLCCRHCFKLHGHGDTNAPAQPEPRIPPRIARRQTIPKPVASRRDIERFYREGKELQRTKLAEQEQANLRAALDEVYSHEQDKNENLSIDPLDPATRPCSRASKSSTIKVEIFLKNDGAAGSMPEKEHYHKSTMAESSMFSFEITTDRAGEQRPDLCGSTPMAKATGMEEAIIDAHDEEPSQGIPRNHHSAEVAKINTSTHLGNHEETNVGGNQVHMKQGSSAGLEIGATITSHSQDLEFPKLNLAIKDIANAKSSVISSRKDSSPESIRPTESTIAPLENTVINETSILSFAPLYYSPNTPAVPKDKCNPEADRIHVTFTDTKSEQALRMGSDTTVTNIFSHIPSLLKPSVSTFSLETFVEHSINSPRTTSPSPPPRMSSIAGPRSRFPYTEFLGPFHDADFSLRSVTPRLAHLQSSSSFYPSLANSVCSVDNLTALERNNNTLSRSTLGKQFSEEGRYSGPLGTESFQNFLGSDFSWDNDPSFHSVHERPSSVDIIYEKRKDGNSAISSANNQTIHDQESHSKRSGSSKHVVDLPDFENTMQTPDTLEANVLLVQSSTIAHRPGHRRTTSSPPLLQVQALRHRESQIPTSILSAPNNDNMPRNLSCDMDQPSTLKIAQTKNDKEDGSLEELETSEVWPEKLMRSRSQKFLKPLATGLNKVRERVGLNSTTRAYPPPSSTQEKRLDDQKSGADIDGSAPASSKMRSYGARRIPIIVADFETIGGSPIRGNSINDLNSTRSRNLSERRGGKSSSLRHRSIRSTLSRNSTLSSIYRTCRNTTYDDCVIFPFGQDGEHEDVDQKIIEENQNDPLRPETSYLKLDNILVEGDDDDGDGSLLKELGNASLNWRNAAARSRRLQDIFQDGEAKVGN